MVRHASGNKGARPPATRYKAGWLLSYDDISESDKEADRQIGEYLINWIKKYAPATLSPGGRSASDGVRAVLEGVSLKIAEKISQLRHYRDNDCQLEHAHTIAEGRISQAAMDLRWVNEGIAALSALPAAQPDGVREITREECVTRNEGWREKGAGK